MHPEQIKTEIRMRGKTSASIAASLKISTSAVCQVIYGRSQSARVMQVISNLLGLPVEKIWVPKPSINRRNVNN